MTSADWARTYGDTLLERLETEANEGWPDLPWPPVTAAEIAEGTQRRKLQQLLRVLAEAMGEPPCG